jgi:hypothetical protein
MRLAKIGNAAKRVPPKAVNLIATQNPLFNGLLNWVPLKNQKMQSA